MNIIVLSGIPGSGKSTWVKSFRKEHKDYYVVSRDKIREMLYGEYRFNPRDETLVHYIWAQSLKVLIELQKNIIIDDTNVSVKGRNQVLWLIKSVIKELDEDIDYKVECLYFKPNPKKNLKNRMKESKGISKEVWKEVIERMNKQWQEPSKHEGFDAVTQLSWR